MIRRILAEPIVHFVLGGLALSVVYAWMDGPADDPKQLVVGQERIEILSRGFERTWQRPPTRHELDGLIDDFALEEILYREAIALGLDRDDSIIRRRLRQKMEFLSEDLFAGAEPTEAELQSFLDAHPDEFELPPETGFRQIFFDPTAPGEAALDRAKGLRSELTAGRSLDEGDVVGDSIALPATLERVTPDEIARVFGTEFADGIAESTPGDWWIVPSSFGVHLVRVDHRSEPRRPRLEEVRDAVSREHGAAQRKEARATFMRMLREQYVVDIRMPLDDGLDRAAEPE